MAPFDIIAGLGKFLGYMVFLAIGLGFGAVLEMSGFGDSRKLAAQFYFKDMTVLKVMFTAIIVAMVLIFGFSALGFLDFSRLYVNPTYLVPGIIGGIIMGLGFIIGGFCPGTSIVALATFKIDGFFFVGGVVSGVFLFGESVSLFEGFHNSTYMGRLILPEIFGVSTGVMVVLVVLMALMMFYGAEIAERFFGLKMKWKEISNQPTDRKKVLASGVLVFIALAVLFAGQPTPIDKWNSIKAVEIEKLETRDVFIHPGELAEVMNDPMYYTRLLDMRSETDYNLFHLENAQRTTIENIADHQYIKTLAAVPGNTVVVVMSNNEAAAIDAYKQLRGQGIVNLYILEGGINNWLTHYPLGPEIADKHQGEISGDHLAYIFQRAVGANVQAANPGKTHEDQEHKIEFQRKIKMQKKGVLAGGCG